MIKIVDIQSSSDHHLWITFSDGEKKDVDMHPFIQKGGVAKPLEDLGYFSKVQIYEGGRGIYWPNEYDMCADFLRYHVN